MPGMSASETGEPPKFDMSTLYQDLYHAPADHAITVDAPELRYLMVDGQGDPRTSQDYMDAIQALYAVAYSIKFMLKKSGGGDIHVMPLEGLWWAANMEAFSMERKNEWQWTAMIAQPDIVTNDIARQAVEQALHGKQPSPALSRVRLDAMREGLSVQVLHIGPYEEEPATISRLHAYMREQGYTFNGKHHEIYLSDLSRTKPARLRTIIRQPVRAAQ